MSQSIKPEEWKPAGGLVLEDVALEAVTSLSNTSVVAGPGAGKTELLAQRAQYLLQTGLCRQPQRILAISFKRDAAKNLKDRVTERCIVEQARRFDSYTFDAFAKGLVDRFLSASPDWCRPSQDYEIDYNIEKEWDGFLRYLNSRLQGKYPEEAAQIMSFLLKEVLALTYLPYDMAKPTFPNAWLAVRWWQHCLKNSPDKLSFMMISQLARSIIQHNPDILKALQVTYAYVFLDEFQDTTGQQWDFVRLAFQGSPAILTAVGDSKQRIMTWAGAEEQVFEWFENEFEAERKYLKMNYRSNRRIVQIINDLTKKIEPEAVETVCGRSEDDVPVDAASFNIFSSDHEEAEWIANYIRQDIDSFSDRKPDDFGLLVRMKADIMEDHLQSAFDRQGLSLRNEARQLNGIAIQDMMADDMLRFLLGILRVASRNTRADELYDVLDTLTDVYGINYERPSDERRLKRIRSNITNAVIRKMSGEITGESVNAVVDVIIDGIGQNDLRGYFVQYENERFFNSTIEAFKKLLSEQIDGLRDWAGILDGAEGVGSVRLMTIHKSKGLEYHTVIFIGLHQEAFWGFSKNPDEETKAFFVALSRARDRIIVTRSRQSGDTTRIQELIDLLAVANIQTNNHSGQG